jgi:surface polysaccharide O-acyltransferase-like enzyme
LNFLRIIACYFAIFNHTGIRGFFLFSLRDVRSVSYWVYIFLCVFCKFSVPLFFMISGALLLGEKYRNESIKRVYTHRVRRMVMTLIVFSFVFYIRNILETDTEFNLLQFFKTLYIADWNFSYWFLYAYLAFLIGLPILRKMVEKMEDIDFVYLMVISIIASGIIPIVDFLIFKGDASINGTFLRSLDWCTSSVIIYPITGYYLLHKVDIEKINKKNIICLTGIDISTIFESCFMTTYQAYLTGICEEGSSQLFLGSFVLFHSMTLFILSRYLFHKYNCPIVCEKIIRSVGRCTFGIYLLHLLFLNKALDKFSILDNYINPMINTFFICLIVLMCGYVVTLILRKIPGIKRLL